MEVARCVPLLLQFLLHLFSTYTNLPHLLSLKQSFPCFLPLHPQLALFAFSIHFMYHCFHQNIFLSSSQSIRLNQTTSHYCPLPAYLLLLSIPTCPSAPLYSSCPPTLHYTLPSPLIFLLSFYFIFSQTSRFTSI